MALNTINDHPVYFPSRYNKIDRHPLKLSPAVGLILKSLLPSAAAAAAGPWN